MGRRISDRTGQSFGLIIVEGRAGTDEHGYPLWTVVCRECGVRRVTRVDSYKQRPPTTHIACAKAKWAEREKVLLAERERESR
jgi:hypothetical protein